MPEAQAPRVRPQDFYTPIGIAREFGSMLRQGFPAIARKYVHWESVPFVKENVERGAGNAIRSMHSQLLQGARQGSAPDRKAYQDIFGKDPLDQSVDHTPSFSNVKYLSKGWNSYVLSFDTNPTGIKGEEKKWVIKIGYKKSPNEIFFLNPGSRALSDEIRQDLVTVEKGMVEEDVRLPRLLPALRVVKHSRFENYRGKEIERTVIVTPYEKILTLVDVRSAVRSSPVLKDQLEGEFIRFCNLRKWLIKNHHLDFDFTGSDNVVVVQESDGLHIRLLDLGLRHHEKNAPLGHAQFDYFAIKHGVELRRAVLGRFGNDHLTEDRAAELDIVSGGRAIRRQRRTELFQQWVQQITPRRWRTSG